MQTDNMDGRSQHCDKRTYHIQTQKNLFSPAMNVPSQTDGL